MPYGLSEQASALLAKVQRLFGADNVQVTSGRGSRVGVAGGSATSQHPSGNAFDFHVKGMAPAQVQAAIAASGIPFGQSIQEYGAAAGAGLNHLGVGSKGQLLKGVNGNYTGIGYANKVSDTVAAHTRSSVADIMARVFGEDSLHSLGVSLSAPGDAVDAAVAGATPDFNSWFVRIGFGLLALLLITVALVMLAPKATAQIRAALPV